METVGPGMWIAPFFALSLWAFMSIRRETSRLSILHDVLGKARNVKEAIDAVDKLYPYLPRASGRKSDAAS